MHNQLWKLLRAAALLSALAFPATGYGQFYIGGGGGQSEYQDVDEVQSACATAGAVCTADETDSAFKFFAGYRIAPYLAVEGGYLNLGESAADATAPLSATATLGAQGGYVALMPHIPIGNTGSIFGRIGISAVEAELTVTSGGATATDSTGAAALVFGAGAEIRLTETVAIRGEWERHSFDEALEIAGIEVEAPDVDVLSASLVISF